MASALIFVKILKLIEMKFFVLPQPVLFVEAYAKFVVWFVFKEDSCKCMIFSYYNWSFGLPLDVYDWKFFKFDSWWTRCLWFVFKEDSCNCMILIIITGALACLWRFMIGSFSNLIVDKHEYSVVWMTVAFSRSQAGGKARSCVVILLFSKVAWSNWKFCC